MKVMLNSVKEQLKLIIRKMEALASEKKWSERIPEHKPLGNGDERPEGHSEWKELTHEEHVELEELANTMVRTIYPSDIASSLRGHYDEANKIINMKYDRETDYMDLVVIEAHAQELRDIFTQNIYGTKKSEAPKKKEDATAKAQNGKQ
ncbi:hypothetical protein DdX_16211 [Ditylenchus destructor]|uniref:Uncharacterized protein n=1 Tax=Ditylenchus destructor TaxID=166010 RepID=A0AAD4MRE0_9BILA|nr:hypothetical protein DdX_16211 [Ditylenchus destructor]